MAELPKPDPAMYAKLRRLALQPRPAGAADVDPAKVRVIVMDLPLTGAMVSVMAAVDGSASLYFSNGGGMIGGGRRHAQIREAAAAAVALSGGLRPHFRETLSLDLPPAGQVFFYAAHAVGMSVAVASQAELAGGTGPLLPLWMSMQRIMTLYRTLPMGHPKGTA